MDHYPSNDEINIDIEMKWITAQLGLLLDFKFGSNQLKYDYDAYTFDESPLYLNELSNERKSIYQAHGASCIAPGRQAGWQASKSNQIMTSLNFHFGNTFFTSNKL